MIPAYRRVGSGTTLVCHPGGPGFSSRSFGDFAGLDEELELVLVDPRGTGGTPRPDESGEYLIEHYVADLEELREHLGLERMNLLGWSHGGVIAMAYASSHPQRVEKLVLVATLARFDATHEEAMVAAMEKRSGEPWYADAQAALQSEQAGQFATDEELGALVSRELPLYFARYDAVAAAHLAAIQEPVNADTLRKFNVDIFPSFDLRAGLADVEAPTLVLVGEEDFICGPSVARDIAAAIPHARVVTLGGVGHFIPFEAPERFREEVLAFLRT